MYRTSVRTCSSNRRTQNKGKTSHSTNGPGSVRSQGLGIRVNPHRYCYAADHYASYAFESDFHTLPLDVFLEGRPRLIPQLLCEVSIQQTPAPRIILVWGVPALYVVVIFNKYQPTSVLVPLPKCAEVTASCTSDLNGCICICTSHTTP